MLCLLLYILEDFHSKFLNVNILAYNMPTYVSVKNSIMVNSMDFDNNFV